MVSLVSAIVVLVATVGGVDAVRKNVCLLCDLKPTHFYLYEQFCQSIITYPEATGDTVSIGGMVVLYMAVLALY